VILNPDWAEAQIRLMRSDEKIGIAGCSLLYSGNTELLYASHGIMSRYGIGWDGGRAEPASSFRRVRPCLWANTSALMARRKLLEELGGFDDAMFLGCEDSDLGWRSNIFGWRVVSNPEAVAVHMMHGTLDPGRLKGQLLYLIWRNRLRSALVNYQPLSLMRYTAVFLLLSVADAVVRGPRREKFSALLWNARHVRDTWSRRRYVQSRRVIRDRDLWPLFQYGFRGPGNGFYPRGSAPAGLTLTEQGARDHTFSS
jgi:GT2 family glycosyltransferase